MTAGAIRTVAPRRCRCSHQSCSKARQPENPDDQRKRYQWRLPPNQYRRNNRHSLTHCALDLRNWAAINVMMARIAAEKSTKTPLPLLRIRIDSVSNDRSTPVRARLTEREYRGGIGVMRCGRFAHWPRSNCSTTMLAVRTSNRADSDKCLSTAVQRRCLPQVCTKTAMLAAGRGIPGAKSRVPNPGCGIPGAESQVPGYQSQVTSRRLPGSGYPAQVAGLRGLANLIFST